MKIVKVSCFLLICVLLLVCTNKENSIKIKVKNNLDIERSHETVELTASFLEIENLTSIGIRDLETQKLVVTQTVDKDNDGVMDKLLFQPIISANSEKTYEIVIMVDEKKTSVANHCYSRFVPERTDDYTWENDKVAFRVFGPVAQKMIEDNIPGGTLSSGVDAWLKKVDYSIIDKWYAKTVAGTGSYHEDTGEGLDNFHVGASRGVGGIAVKTDNTYYFPKNFIEWRTITTGPIRTSFYLKYANWDAGGQFIEESKIVSLDYGQNLSKFETAIKGSNSVSVGLTLHENDGEVTGNHENGWVSYWQPHGDSELGTAILTHPNNFQNFDKYVTEARDLSNAYGHLKIVDNQVTYFAGFGWKESGQFNNKNEWEAYLNLFSKKINNPLAVTKE